MQAFAAGSTGNGFAPGCIEVGNDPYLVTAVFDIPVMRAFHFIAYAYTARTHNAAVMIQYIPGVRGIHFALRKQVRVADMIQAYFVPEILQFTLAIGHTYGTNVIPLGKKQFGGNPLVFPDTVRIRTDDHVGGHFCGTGAEQFIHAFDFHEAKPAGTDIQYAFQVAHGEDLNIIFTADLQYGFTRIRFYLFIIYCNWYGIHITVVESFG